MNTQACGEVGAIACQQCAVTLLGYKDMQTNFLSSLINDELGMSCQVQSYTVGEKNRLLVDSSLVVIDCKHVPVEEIGLFLSDISQERDDQRVALVNVPSLKHYDKLVQWPQIKGVFYETVEQANLLQGLRELLSGGNWLPREVMQKLIDEYRSAPRMQAKRISLTRRERQILKMLLEGSTNLEIATVLGVSEYTIKSHLYNVFKKIGVKNRIQAYNWSQMHLGDD